MISTSLGPLAQLVEQEAFNLCVIGSNPIRPTIFAKISIDLVISSVKIVPLNSFLSQKRSYKICARSSAG